MGMNYQDVIRDVHDPANHALNISGTIQAAGQATVNINGAATIYAVVNTSAAGDPKVFIGLTTAVLGSAATLYAVVNTSAPGVGNSIVTIANTPLSTQIIGNVTVYLSPYSFYQQSSLVSGYVYYGFALPGSNPTTANFKIQRETLDSGEVLFASGAATFTNTWSSASLATITYL